jgi:hypothetical protein
LCEKYKSKRDSRGNNLFHYIADKEWEEDEEEKIVECGVEFFGVNATNLRGETVSMLFTHYHLPGRLKEIFKFKPNLKLRDTRGSTAAIHAFINVEDSGDTEVAACVELLLKEDPEMFLINDAVGKSVWHYVCKRDIVNNDFEEKQTIDLYEKIYEVNKFIDQADEQGNTPLHYTTNFSDIFMEFYVGKSKVLEPRNKERQTPAMFALRRKFLYASKRLTMIKNGNFERPCVVYGSDQ